MSVTEAAQRLGVSRQAFSALLNGRACISAEMDLRLADALSTTPGFWLRMQVQRDLWEAQRNRNRMKVNRLLKFAPIFGSHSFS